jgi:hypothetical protein
MENQWVLCEVQHKINGSNDKKVAEEVRLSRKGPIISSFTCEPLNRLLEFVAGVSENGIVRCKHLFAQTL